MSVLVPEQWGQRPAHLHRWASSFASPLVLLMWVPLSKKTMRQKTQKVPMQLRELHELRQMCSSQTLASKTSNSSGACCFRRQPHR